MISHFVLLMMLGISLMWCLMPRAQVTCGFFRIQMLVVLGLSVLAAVATPERAVCGLAFAIAALSFAGSVVWTLDRRQAGAVLVHLIAGCSAAAVLLAGDRGAGGRGALQLVSEFSTAAVLGSAVTGMLLGHWYLTAPTMSLEPLRRLALYFGGAVVLRLVVSAVGLVFGWQALAGPTVWTWFALRWLAGIAGPLLISVMAVRILRYRNTQAATGVLFAGVILTFIGELSAALLYEELRFAL